MQFYSRFNVAPCLNKDKVYSRKDNVDRLSFIDSSKQVRTLIQSGQDLKLWRAKALNGMFSVEEAVKESGDLPAVPVYGQDPVIASRMCSEYQDARNELAASRVAAQRSAAAASAAATLSAKSRVSAPTSDSVETPKSV